MKTVRLGNNCTTEAARNTKFATVISFPSFSCLSQNTRHGYKDKRMKTYLQKRRRFRSSVHHSQKLMLRPSNKPGHDLPFILVQPDKDVMGQSVSHSDSHCLGLSVGTANINGRRKWKPYRRKSEEKKIDENQVVKRKGESDPRKRDGVRKRRRATAIFFRLSHLKERGRFSILSLPRIIGSHHCRVCLSWTKWCSFQLVTVGVVSVD